jgi:Putative zinc-finger
MNCQQVRVQLTELLYGDIAPSSRTELEKHLASCPACNEEHRALANVRVLLDLPQAPPTAISLPGLYRLLAERETQRTRRWRRVALALTGVAALLAILALGARLDARVQDGQLVLRWGPPPERGLKEAHDTPAGKPAQGLAEPASAQALEDQLYTVSKILHALVDDLRGLEQREQMNAAELRGRLKEIHEYNLRRFAALEKNLEALYVTSQKGE